MRPYFSTVSSHQSLHIGETTHIGCPRPSRTAAIDNRFGGGFAARRIDVCDDYLRALFGKAPGIGFADAVGGAGDDRDLFLVVSSVLLARGGSRVLSGVEPA